MASHQARVARLRQIYAVLALMPAAADALLHRQAVTHAELTFKIEMSALHLRNGNWRKRTYINSIGGNEPSPEWRRKMMKMAMIAAAAVIGSAGAVLAEPITSPHVSAQEFLQQEASRTSAAPQVQNNFDHASAGQYYASEFQNVSR